MADIQTARFGKLLQAAFNLKQRLTLGQAMPDVLPVFELQRPAPELAMHAGIDLAAGTIIMGGSPATFSWAILQALGAANRIVVVERFIVNNPTAAPIAYYWGIGGGTGLAGTAATQTPQYRDSRRSGQGRPSAQLRILSSAASMVTNPMGEIIVPALDARTVEGPWVISNTGAPTLPNSTFIVECGTVNTGHQVSFQWHERNLDPGELAL